MAQANFSLGQVNLTGYLNVTARNTLDLTTVVQRQQINLTTYPAPNISFPNLPSGIYQFDFYNATDVNNITGLLYSSYTVKVQDNVLATEKRIYTGGGGMSYDPPAGASNIPDAYLNGKNVVSVSAEGFRALDPLSEYSLIAGGGIRLLLGKTLADGEKMAVDISYMVPVTTTTGVGLFQGAVTITESAKTLDSSHYNKLLYCESGTTRQVIMLPFISSMPDGAFFYPMTHGGTQYQTKFITQGSDRINFCHGDHPEITLGIGEYLWIEKRGTKFRVLDCAPGLYAVGEKMGGDILTRPNTIPEDDRIVDGDDIPRLYYWLNLFMPITQKIVITDSALNSYARPAGREGAFITCSDSKRFRMPNTQGLYKKGLNSFTNYGSDATRPYDYPGGVQPAQVGESMATLMGKTVKKSGNCYPNYGISWVGRYRNT